MCRATEVNLFDEVSKMLISAIGLQLKEISVVWGW